MPTLTEGWAAAYFGALVVVLVFAVGLQGLVYQILVPDDLRALVHRQGETRWPTMIAVSVLLAALSFIWVVHPDAGAPVNTSAPVMNDARRSALGAVIVTFTLLATVGYVAWLIRNCSR